MFKGIFRKMFEKWLRERAIHLPEHVVERIEKQTGMPKEIIRKVEKAIADEVVASLFEG